MSFSLLEWETDASLEDLSDKIFKERSELFVKCLDVGVGSGHLLLPTELFYQLGGWPCLYLRRVGRSRQSTLALRTKAAS